MDNNFLHLHLFENKDIEKYLSISFIHLNIIISTLEKLSENECEKDHIVDILNECVYIKENLITLIHNYQQYENEESFIKIQDNIKTLYCIEEELISDYPDLFENNDPDWYIYQPQCLPNTNSTINTTCIELPQISSKKSCKISIKRWAFGFFFLLPTFLFVVFYPLLHQEIYKAEENHSKQYLFEHDRAYKNIFYLYSAILKNKSADNFYSLMKSNSFKLPEGFVVIDKNLMVDYYLKEYYSLNKIEDEVSFTVIAVSNLNFRQCKYILTKFSGIAIEKIISNDKEIIFDETFNPNNYCHSEKNTHNLISLYIKND